MFGHPAEFIVLAPSGLRKGNRYLVRVTGQAGETLARQAGLIDSYGGSAGRAILQSGVPAGTG